LGKSKYNFFCSKSCSASYNNKNRFRSDSSKIKTSESLKKHYIESNKNGFRSNSSKSKNSESLKEDYVESNKNRSENVDIQCENCKTIFSKKRNSTKKYCSKNCSNLVISLKRQKYLKENGNFSTLRESFTYGDITIDVDSNLEKAGIIYLKDKLNAKRIERFINILFYKDGDKTRTFNPDFICEIDGLTYIAEVKQKWLTNCNHSYNRNIPAKREALEKFCKEKNYGCLWIDFITAPELKSIYRNVLKSTPPFGIEPKTVALHLTH
jgi:hypothetical protein